jgi:hypothetical protein
MAENHETGHESEKHIPAEADNETDDSEKDSGVIELSDIAIGITPEDDAIVELTEELIGEAFIGFAGATSDMLHDDERRLDLSETFPGLGPSPDDSRSGIDSKAPVTDAVVDESDMENDNLEAEITHELDSYFGTEEDAPVIEETTPIAPPNDLAKSLDDTEEDSGVHSVDEKKIQPDDISVTSRQLDDALERVIRKMFAEKINRILDEIIERTVSEEISQLKDYLIGISVKD